MAREFPTTPAGLDHDLDMQVVMGMLYVAMIAAGFNLARSMVKWGDAWSIWAGLPPSSASWRELFRRHPYDIQKYGTPRTACIPGNPEWRRLVTPASDTDEEERRAAAHQALRAHWRAIGLFLAIVAVAIPLSATR